MCTRRGATEQCVSVKLRNDGGIGKDHCRVHRVRRCLVIISVRSESEGRKIAASILGFPSLARKLGEIGGRQARQAGKAGHVWRRVASLKMLMLE